MPKYDMAVDEVYAIDSIVLPPLKSTHLVFWRKTKNQHFAWCYKHNQRSRDFNTNKKARKSLTCCNGELS